jgi:hypothetical protein
MAATQTTAKCICGRTLRAAKSVKLGYGPRVSSDGTATYETNTAAQSCTCKAGQRGIRCYHLAAAEILVAA